MDLGGLYFVLPIYPTSPIPAAFTLRGLIYCTILVGIVSGHFAGMLMLLGAHGSDRARAVCYYERAISPPPCVFIESALTSRECSHRPYICRADVVFDRHFVVAKFILPFSVLTGPC